MTVPTPTPDEVELHAIRHELDRIRRLLARVLRGGGTADDILEDYEDLGLEEDEDEEEDF